MTTRKVPCVVAAAVLAAALADPGWAAMIPDAIPGVTGTAFQQGDSADPGNGSISRSLDGSGLTVGDPGDPSTWTHNSSWPDNWQGGGSFTGGNTPGAWFVADLGATYWNVDAAHIWNVREVLDRGTKDVDVYYAVSPTVAPATGSSYDFSSGGWTSLTSLAIPQATGGGTPADTVIDLDSVSSARYVGFDMNTNYGSTFRIGFAEMQFTTAPPGLVLPIAGATGHQQGDSAAGDGSILTAINGAGTSQPDPYDPSTWTHTNTWQTDWQGSFPGGSAQDAVGGWAVIDLGSVPSNLPLEDLYLWNVNEANALDRGTREFDIYYAVSPTVTPPAIGGFQPYDFSSGGWTQLGSTQTLVQGTASGALPVGGVYDISGATGARYLGIDILSNYGSTFRVGLAEIAVTATIPEPSTFALAALGLLGLGLVGWRRRRRAG